MRLLIIILVGSILIGLTYMWSNGNNNAQEKEPDLTAMLPRRTPKKTTNLNPTNDNSGSDTQPKAEIKATTEEEAQAQARVNAGAKDPFAPIAPAIENSGSQEVKKNNTKGKKGPDQSNIPAGMVPPPPPNSLSLEELKNMPGLAKTPGSLASGLNISELPLPPRDQSVANKLRLTGIVGDRAFFTVVDRLTAHANHWPTEFSLKPGHAFHSVYLKAINDHSATLEEDGEEYLRTLPSIR